MRPGAVHGHFTRLRLLQQPGSILNLIAALTVLGTAALAAIEASYIGMGRGKPRNGPVAPFFCMLLCWVVIYPVSLISS